MSILRFSIVCQSRDVRNSPENFKQLEGCRVIEGFLMISLMDRYNESHYENWSFPLLTEITDFLLVYRVNGLKTLMKLFPNLRIIRGNQLIKDYALIVYEMMHLTVRRFTLILIYILWSCVFSCAIEKWNEIFWSQQQQQEILMYSTPFLFVCLLACFVARAKTNPTLLLLFVRSVAGNWIKEPDTDNPWRRAYWEKSHAMLCGDDKLDSDYNDRRRPFHLRQ